MKYYNLRYSYKKAERKRIIDRLLSLKEDLTDKVPQKLFNENVLIATWNLRDFDSNKFGYGHRSDESIYYIAEVISAFDIVALQEVNENTYGLERLMYRLGDDWDYIMTDVSGNGERMVYVYDTNRVSFKKMAGEIVLDKKELVSGELQFARTPFIVSFQSEWFKFKLCTVHIYYGEISGAKFRQRVSEIDKVAKQMAKRAKKYDENLILLGDFNIESPEHETMEALTKHKFIIPEPIRVKPVYTNAKKTKYYDQIAYREKKDEVRLGEGDNSAGAYNFFEQVYSPDQWDVYANDIIKNAKGKIKEKTKELNKTSSAKRKATLTKQITKLETLINSPQEIEKYYDKWRTFQMSDHLPMWVELKINFSVDYLNRIKEEK